MVVPAHRIAIYISHCNNICNWNWFVAYVSDDESSYSVQSMILEGSIPFYNCNVMAHSLHNLLLIHNYVIRFPNS